MQDVAGIAVLSAICKRGNGEPGNGESGNRGIGESVKEGTWKLQASQFSNYFYRKLRSTVYTILQDLFVSTDGLAAINPTRLISLKICKRGNLKTERRN